MDKCLDLIIMNRGSKCSPHTQRYMHTHILLLFVTARCYSFWFMFDTEHLPQNSTVGSDGHWHVCPIDGSLINQKKNITTNAAISISNNFPQEIRVTSSHEWIFFSVGYITPSQQYSNSRFINHHCFQRVYSNYVLVL